MTSTTTFTPGDIIRTKTGRNDAVVLAYLPATPPEEAARMIEATEKAGSGPLPRKKDCVEYRILRDGKPYGPVRSARPDTLTLVTAAR
jgi:hypothetical protein